MLRMLLIRSILSLFLPIIVVTVGLVGVTLGRDD